MTNFGWSLPPGTPGPHEESVEFRCVNPECPSYGVAYELAGVWELGSVSLNNEDEVPCPDCEWERSDEWHDYYPIVEDKAGTPVLVSLHDDAAIRVTVSKDEDGDDMVNVRRATQKGLEAMKVVLKQEYESRLRYRVENDRRQAALRTVPPAPPRP